MVGNTEFDILKASHKFLREDDEQNLTWEDQVAKKYYDSLFREFAVCNLKHYKTGQFALRWRSESEVLSGAGEETCGNTRCTFHEPSRSLKVPPLKTVELPFAYEEEGSVKSALVKVVLCDKCLKKLMYKREKERERAEGRRGEGSKEEDADAEKETEQGDELDSSADVPEERRDRKDRRDRNSRHKEHRRDRNSRSRSPRRRESNSQAT
ncbi:hypothetical protein SCHPADRAFT_907520 [Schizopora paradoxa]|uniref:Folate-sensitive fragile site protein Fra10Ac1 n=1 Tax=Schizopora paradoxa TaxID=27342 RepID=A0A0H2RJX5_9AGAM|nr:hypothetical protein SCHPADRAFT_907520 [Schizopora paradoxa]